MKVYLSLLVIVAFFSTSCTLVSRKDIEEGRPRPIPGKTGDEDVVTSDDIDDDEIKQKDVVIPKRRQRPKVAVVLGPGGFKTLAYASLVKSLQKSGVPKDKVVGIGWGSLVGGFWALNGQPHEAEWKVFKLNDDIFSSGGFFSSGEGGVQSDKLRPYLKENLTNLDLSKLKIDFTCPSLSLKNGSVTWPKRGSLSGVVENCLVAPPQVSPANINSSRMAALMTLRETARALKREGYGVVILVNVLGSEDFLPADNKDWVTRAYWLEVRRSMWTAKSEFTDVIDLNTSRSKLFDMSAKKAYSRHAEAIGSKVGRELVEKYKF